MTRLLSCCADQVQRAVPIYVGTALCIQRSLQFLRVGRENAPVTSEGYFAASVTLPAGAGSVALPAGEPIAWNSNAVSLSRALS